ncbi:peptidoglycan editing factor PgeF [Parabacteroides distasonis]|nr:peptidoglycan editing factor PgeF [Parabacteroides distasonis]
MLRLPLLEECRGISHFFTTRQGGVSRGMAFGSMNPGLYTADDPEAVRRNLAILAERIGLPVTRIVMPHQTHEDRLLTIDADFLAKPMAEQRQLLEGMDGLMTAEPQLCVAVSTADCVPLLLYAPDQAVVAAVHAGWRGTVKGIAQKAVRQLQSEFGCDPTLVRAAIGPSISQAAFEVGEEVVEAFASAGMPLYRLMRRDPNNGKAHIDLWGANRWQLMEAGVEATHIEIAGICTYSQWERFFSARRLGVQSGRIVSGIFKVQSKV